MENMENARHVEIDGHPSNICDFSIATLNHQKVGWNMCCCPYLVRGVPMTSFGSKKWNQKTRSSHKKCWKLCVGQLMKPLLHDADWQNVAGNHNVRNPCRWFIQLDCWYIVVLIAKAMNASLLLHIEAGNLHRAKTLSLYLLWRHESLSLTLDQIASL
jgi:hypothetical protein